MDQNVAARANRAIESSLSAAFAVAIGDARATVAPTRPKARTTSSRGGGMKPNQRELAAVSRLNPDVSTGDYFTRLGLAAYCATRKAFGLTTAGELALACARLVPGEGGERQPRSVRDMLWELKAAGLAKSTGPTWWLRWSLTAKGERQARLARGGR